MTAKEGLVTRAEKAAPRRKYRTTEAEEDTTLHLRLTPELRRQLRLVLGRMLEDPHADRRERVSYAGAMRYALRDCVERLPAKAEHS